MYDNWLDAAMVGNLAEICLLDMQCNADFDVVDLKKCLVWIPRQEFT